MVPISSRYSSFLLTCFILSIVRQTIDFYTKYFKTPTLNDIEIQDIYEWSNNIRTVAGVRWRQEDIESETFLGNDPLSNKTHSLFANIEYKLSEASVINAGASWEDEDETKDFLAPRFAFNQHIGDNQVVRFIYSEAVRSPNMYEQQGQEPPGT